jgi:Glycosyl transferase family 2
MRLIGVSMVRNEADGIETFVRHNLSVLDGLTVIDHHSQDGTTDILAALQDEGLSLRLVMGVEGRDSAEQLTLAARELLTREGADFVLPIDADEFLKVPSRERLGQALAAVAPEGHAVVQRLTYVTELRDSQSRTPRPADLRWRLKEEQRDSYRAVIGRGFLKPAQHLVFGNQLVDDPTRQTPLRHVQLGRDVAALAHLRRDERRPARTVELVEDPVPLNVRLRYVGMDALGGHPVPTVFPEALPRRPR